MRPWQALAVLVVALACAKDPEPQASGPAAMPTAPQVVELNAESDPGAVDDTLIAHIQAEQYERAYRLMASAYRASVPYERFRVAVSQNAWLKNTQYIGCGEVSTSGRVHERNCILHSSEGDAAATLFYTRDTEGWRMTGMLIGGTPAFPGPGRSAPNSGLAPW